ncbi:MAG: OmpH family outer membrane protein [Fibrobacterales bacterium]
MNKVTVSILLISMFMMSCALQKSAPDVKIGYVDTQIIIENFSQAEKVRVSMKLNTQNVQKEVNRLLTLANQKLDLYKKELTLAQKSKNEKRISELKELIQMTAATFENQKSMLQDKLTTTNESISQDVLKRINQYIDEYAQKQGYTVVVEKSSGILYHDVTINITQEILKGLHSK